MRLQTGLLTKIVKIFGIKFSIIKSQDRKVVSLHPREKPIGSVLLSYVIEPFLLPREDSLLNSHTHYWESLQLANTFLDLGFAVDVISYRNTTFVPKKPYTIFVGARTNFQRIASLIDKHCTKIVHLDTAHWMYNNFAHYERSLAVQKRRGVTLNDPKLCETSFAIEHADCATVLGNGFTISTYAYANKPIYPLTVPAINTYPSPGDKNFNKCRKHFLWLGSSGLVHKGLDLVLEAFSELKDFQLTVCGDIHRERDFQKVYQKELYETPHIFTAGWIDITSPEFLRITSDCIALVYPSCAEGQSGAVVTCLQAGLIPILSRQCGVDIDNFGMMLEACSIEEIRNKVRELSMLPENRLKEMAVRAWEYARAAHTREEFAHKYKRLIQRIIADRLQPLNICASSLDAGTIPYN